MAKQLKEIEIPFGAKDSELCGWEYTIPEGMEATIVDNKIVIKKKESEDERVRKSIIDFFSEPSRKEYILNGFTVDDIIAWIKKQGEKKPADKIEPKFKKGDWVVYNGFTYQITEVYEDGYSNDKQGFIPLKYQDEMRLWDISKDAKDGDVLFTSSTASHETFMFKSIDEKGNAKCYFTHDSEDGFREGKYHFIGSATNCKPATKEQRYLLFQKMKEAGYEWDAEHKQLKKIEKKEELTEFENIVEEIADTAILNAYGVKELAKRLLSNAKKQLQEEFDKQLEQAYKNADKVQYKRGYRKAVEDARKWLAWYTSDREVTLDRFDAEMEQKLKELSQG